MSDAPNDLVRIGEDAVRKFLRGTRGLQKQIEPMALGLAEARKRYAANRAFGAFLEESPYGEIGKSDRAALIRLGESWSDELRERIAFLTVSSPRLIVEELFPSSHDGNTDDDDEDDGDSGFYGSERRVRSNEAWDTIDPRLVQALVGALPELRKRKIWEPAAGKALMVEQLEEAGCKIEVASDIEPRSSRGEAQNFFDVTEMPVSVDTIVTNPPWGRLAADFVRHALDLAAPARGLVVMLLPLPWITGRQIADLTGSVGLDQIVVPRFRARWMTPEEEASAGGASAPKMNHVWVVWDFARLPEDAPMIVFADDPSVSVEIAEAAE